MLHYQNNPGARKVLIDSDILEQLLRQAQTVEHGQMAVPGGRRVVDEYRVGNDESVIDEGTGQPEDVPEIDVNRKRNRILGQTFHSCFAG